MNQKISLELRGGIGNQLFGIATALFLIQRFDKTIRVSTSNIDRNHSVTGSKVERMGFPKEIFLTRYEMTKSRTKRKISLRNHPLVIIEEDAGASFEEKNEKLIKSIKSHHGSCEILITGFFQDFAYADSISNFHEYVKLENPTINLPENFIAVHIRLSDYQNHKSTLGILATKYYRDAVKLALDKFDLPVLIFSDDIATARYMFDVNPGEDFKFMNSTSMKDPLTTFNVLARANVMILSNSTFSYWAAYLNKNAQLIIYPSELRRDGCDAIKNIPKFWTSVQSVWQD
jgi:hypothetical protein